MSDPLAVSPEGLLSSSAALHEHASRLITEVGTPALTGGKASGFGAAAVSAAIATLSQAYAARLADHGQSAEASAVSYTAADDDGAADIGRVSV